MTETTQPPGALTTGCRAQGCPEQAIHTIAYRCHTTHATHLCVRHAMRFRARLLGLSNQPNLTCVHCGKTPTIAYETWLTA